MRVAILLLASLAGTAGADERDVLRALVQRDQQSAEFAAGARRAELEALHQRQLIESLVGNQAPDYVRPRMAQEREQQLEPRPLPLPGRATARFDAIPLKGFGD